MKAFLQRGIRFITGRKAARRGVAVRDDDIFLVSYPKSGNTWGRFLIGNLNSPEDPVTFANIEQKIPDIYQNSGRALKRITGPRILKSHEYFDPRYRRVINFTRDPRDVLVSYYHHQIKFRLIPADSTIDEFLPVFLKGELGPFGSWQDHVLGWLNAREGDPDFLTVRYEDLLGHTGQELRKIAAFLGVDASEQRLAQAVELSSADRMRKSEREESHLWRATKSARKDKPFVRSARAGGWVDVLTDAQVAAVQAAWPEAMQRLGYIE